MQKRRDFVCTLLCVCVCAFLAAYCNLCLNATTSPPNYASGLRSQVIEGKRNEHSHPAATILDYGYSHGPWRENTHREAVAEITQITNADAGFAKDAGVVIPEIHILLYQQG